MSPRAAALVCLAALVGMAGCTKKSVHWTEEVALSDGRTVLIKSYAIINRESRFGID